MVLKHLHNRLNRISHYGCSTLSLLFLYNVNNSGTASFTLSAKLFPCIVVQLSWETYRDSKSPQDTLWCCNYVYLDFDSTYNNSCT